MKSKNFTAAEKHFIKKEEAYRKQIQAYRNLIQAHEERDRTSDALISELKSQNELLNDWIDRLLEYTELDRADINAACEKDKAMAQAMSLLTLFAKGVI